MRPQKRPGNMRGFRSWVLTYHSIDDTGSVISVRPALFREHIKRLLDADIRIVPLERIRVENGAVALTFDDACSSFYERALPVLTEHGIPATVFVVSGYCGLDNGWPTQPHGVPRLPLMNWAQIREAAAYGISIGAHTVTHPFLTRLSAQEAEREMREVKANIEDRTGLACDAFAYPYGDQNAVIRHMAAQYYSIACTTDLGFISPSSDPMALPRLDMYYLRSPFWVGRMRHASGRAYVRGRQWARSARRVFAR
jgi:peptidoglycan/xylan/chitin deacetylase (PgdA/CDA1 family)